jgi:hypothetical protein
MPKKQLGKLPFPPLITLDTSNPIQADALADLLRKRQQGVSICVRSAEGHPKRGGYFFHVRASDRTLEHCEIFNFEKIAVASLHLEKLTAFINHCAGLMFDEWAFKFCQTVVNFRLDPKPPPDEAV